jgi:hypothetical protein
MMVKEIAHNRGLTVDELIISARAFLL